MNETRKPTLLIVDDEPANVDIIMAALGNDYSVCVESDSLKALDVAKKCLFSDPIITRSTMEEIIRLRNRVGR